VIIFVKNQQFKKSLPETGDMARERQKFNLNNFKRN
jgi:hypothetical protein